MEVPSRRWGKTRVVVVVAAGAEEVEVEVAAEAEAGAMEKIARQLLQKVASPARVHATQEAT
jgi:hypothetical protein